MGRPRWDIRIRAPAREAHRAAEREAAEEVARDAPWWHNASREARPAETFARRRNFLFPSAQVEAGDDAAPQESPERELNQDLAGCSTVLTTGESAPLPGGRA